MCEDRYKIGLVESIRKEVIQIQVRLETIIWNQSFLKGKTNQYSKVPYLEACVVARDKDHLDVLLAFK